MPDVLWPPTTPPTLILGDARQSGAYVLGISLSTPLTLSFGRFLNGRPVSLDAGGYAYVGSAMGARGSSSLAHRLLRHATRTGRRPPHALRAALLAALRAAQLGPASLQPPTGKTVRWHIDYLLDESSVALERVVAVRSGVMLERPLVAWLAARPEATAAAPGLGAGDHPGHSHLLRLSQPAAVWSALVDQVALL